MKKLIIMYILCAVVQQTGAQSISNKVIPTCGGFLTGGGNTLSFTAGETFNTTLQNGNTLLTQGFQQPYITLRILNLRAFIQGYYLAGTGEQVPVLLNAGVGTDPLLCDSIIVELHDQFIPAIVVAINSVALHTDGWAQLVLPGALNGGSYYIVIRTRNTIETWSKLPVTLGTITTYDFTN